MSSSQPNSATVSIPGDFAIMALTPIVAALIGASLVFYEIWTTLSPELRDWQLFRSAVEADWDWVCMMSKVYATTGFVAGIVAAAIFSLFRLRYAKC